MVSDFKFQGFKTQTTDSSLSSSEGDLHVIIFLRILSTSLYVEEVMTWKSLPKRSAAAGGARASRLFDVRCSMSHRSFDNIHHFNYMVNIDDARPPTSRGQK